MHVSALRLGRLRVMAIIRLTRLAHADHRRAGYRVTSTDSLSADAMRKENA